MSPKCKTEEVWVYTVDQAFLNIALDYSSIFSPLTINVLSTL